MMGKNIVILGGGPSGVIAAMALAEAKRKHGLDFDVTLVTRDEWHYMPPLWMDIALEGLPVDETRAPIRGLEKYGARVILREAEKIDAGERRVELAGGETLGYDYLFVALGLRNGWEAYPGLAEAGYHNYSPEGALEMHEALKSFKGGRVVIAVPEIPFRCGIYPMEFASVLGYKLRVKGVKAEIKILSPKIPGGGDLSMALGPDIKRLWDKYFSRFGVEIKTHDGFERVDPEKRLVVTKNYEEPYDLLIKVPPPRLPRILEDPLFKWEEDGRFAKARARDFRHPEYDDIVLTGEHSMPPTGLSLAGVFVHAATSKAVQQLLDEAYGVGEVHEIPSIACVAYSGDKGFMGVCEVEFDGSRYTWDNCYNVAESSVIKYVKRGFYQGWLDRLRV